MAKKSNVKALLLEKGEKFALIGAGAVMLLFAVLGVVEMSGGFSPDDFEKQVLATTSKVEGTINGAVTSGSVTPLEKEHLELPKQQPVTTTWANHLFFDPIAPPDKRRINPIVLPISEVQADYIPAKIIAYDIQKNANGVDEIAVLTQAGKKDEKLDAEGARREVNTIANRIGGLRMARPQAPREGVAPKKADLPQGVPIEEGQRQNVEYVTLDPEKLVGKRFAWTIYPQRMVVVQASFPYRAQIDEIQKALRLESPLDVFNVYANEETPFFRGVLVQRQVLTPDGKNVVVPWTDLDVYSHYASTIYPRKYGDRPDDASVNYVLLHKGHRLTMPLPLLLAGKYPDFRMSTINDTIRKQTALRKPPPQPKAPSQFTGDGDIFDPVNPSAGGAVGQPNVGGEGINVPKGGGRDLDMKGGEPVSVETKLEEIPEHILIRLIDNDIQPGRLYQYRLKVLMQNPNWRGPKDAKKDTYPFAYKVKEVSRPADAEVMLLGADSKDDAVVKARFKLDGDELRKNLNSDTPWTELKGTVSVPREEYLFAVDPPLDGRGKPQPPLKQGQGLLQIQRWLPIASIGTWKEPVADWVIADIIATRGTYLNGRTLVMLPIWSSQFNRHILREAPPEKGKTQARRGVFMDPTRPGPQYIVADVEGGYRENSLLTRTGRYMEETAAEILLLDENGELTVRSSFADRVNTGRSDREAAWRAWIERAERETSSLIPESTIPKKKDGFD